MTPYFASANAVRLGLGVFPSAELPNVQFVYSNHHPLLSYSLTSNLLYALFVFLLLGFHHLSETIN